MSPALLCLALTGAAGGAAPVPASAPVAAPDPGPPPVGAPEVTLGAPAPAQQLDVRLQLSQITAVDDASPQALIVSQGRGTLSAQDLFGVDALQVEVDGRGRHSWNDGRSDRFDLSRAFVQLGDADRGWAVSAGRRTLALAPAQVDGVTGSFWPFAGLELLAFGGLMPHPVTLDFNTDFAVAGAGYEVRGRDVNHAGGMGLQLYRGQPDRLWVSERWYLRLSSAWAFFGQVTLDLLGRQGLVGDLLGVPAAEQNEAERLDVSQAYLKATFRPASWLRLGLTADHTHTVLPNLWWDDWLEHERVRLGFSLNGPDPVGTRRSRVQLDAAVPLSTELAPYGRLRYDLRHVDVAHGFEGRVGAKYTPSIGYLDVSYAFRRAFAAVSHLGSLQIGRDFAQTWGVQASAVLMNMRPLSAGERGRTLYDLSAGGWLALFGFRLHAEYQAFVEPKFSQHVFFVLLEYRYRDDEG